MGQTSNIITLRKQLKNIVFTKVVACPLQYEILILFIKQKKFRLSI